MSRVQMLGVLVMGAALAVLLVGCSDDDNGGSEADLLYIGGVCAMDTDCNDGDTDTPELECVTDFKGGYCGIKDCVVSEDCPQGSLCADLDGTMYCFLVCIDKAECNTNRPADLESNCSSNVDPVEGGDEKLCIPPAAS